MKRLNNFFYKGGIVKIQDEIHQALLSIDNNLRSNIDLKDYHKTVLLLTALLEEEALND